jgi:hypothetical protein
MRLNQSRRGLIGYTYCPMVYNDITLQPITRKMSEVQEQTFDQKMTGEGVVDVVRGMVSRGDIIKHGPKVIDAVVKGIQFLNSEKGQSLKDNIKSIAPKATENVSNIVNKFTPPSKYENAIKDIQKGNGLNPAGGGLNPAGDGMLPGDMLKKKLLSKMVRERRMKILGSSKPDNLSASIKGGSIVISGSSSGQSRSKTLPGSSSYKLNPRPLVGAGLDPKTIIEGLQKMVIPMLKKNNLVPDAFKNSDKIKKLISLKAKNIMNTVKDPKEIIKKVLESLPMLSMKGTGIGDTLNRIASKILAGILRINNPDSVFAKGLDSLAGSGKHHKGGFFFAIAAIIAAISAAASAAAATTVVGSVTVGALAGAALTGAAGATGAAIVNKIAGGSIKAIVLKTIKDTKLTLKDFSTDGKIKLKAGFEALKKNPTKEGIVAIAKKLAPVAREAMKKKLAKKIDGMAGSGLSGGSQAKKFDNNFVKHFTSSLT